jgi:hypothetical protein
VTGQVHGFRILNIIKEKLCAAWWAGRGGVVYPLTGQVGHGFRGVSVDQTLRVPDIRNGVWMGQLCSGYFSSGHVCCACACQWTGQVVQDISVQECMSVNRTGGFRDILQMCSYTSLS